MDKLKKKRLRQHPLWIIYQIGLSVKEVIIPVIIFFIINLRNEALWVKLGSIALILYIIFRIITIIFQWKNHTYLFTDKNLEMTEGRFITNKRYVALNRIQSFQQTTSVVHRLFNLTSLSLITGATSDNSVIRFDMVTNGEAERIKQIITNVEQERDPSSLLENSVKEKKERILHYQISFKEICFISLTSVYVIAVFPVLSSIYFKVSEFFRVDDVANKFFAFLSESWTFIILLLIAVIVTSILSGFIITYIRFGNYKVFSDKEQIYIEKGIFNISTYSIPREKINGILIEKNMIRGIFDIVKVSVVRLGDMFNDDDEEIDVLFPFIKENRVKQLLPQTLPPYEIQEKMHSLPNQALFVNLIQPSYSLVIVTFFIFFFWPEYWLIPVFFFLFIVISRIMKTYRTKHIVIDEWIQLQTGVFITERFLTNRKKIDQLEIDQSWMERRLGLATITITSRANPVYVCRLEHVSKQTALHYYYWYKGEEDVSGAVPASKNCH